MKSTFAVICLAALCSATSLNAQTFTPGTSAPWLKQITLPTSVWTGTKGGAGAKIGIVDTGIIADNPTLVGRVSSLSSCAAVSFRCSNGARDDNGHGTAVAAIAAGAYRAPNGVMSGVAPGATIIGVKVLNSAGSGLDTDVSNGIRKAADAGASVINLSLTYAPTTSIVQAINYATAKGAVIVFAGGNENRNLANGAGTSGLTTASLSRLIFVGSVNASNVKSSFSNRPGAASASAGTQTASYANLWVMAPGEGIVAPSINYGANANAYWSGTSMAAPVVTGSLALLQTAWPVLVRNGTATAVLFASTTDLGAAGVDQTYGRGLINLERAFLPIGSMSALGPNGKTIALGADNKALVSSTVLGSLKGLGTALSQYTVFDGYSRDFTANLSTLLTVTTPSKASLGSLAYTPIWGGKVKLADGGYLQMQASDADEASALYADSRTNALQDNQRTAYFAYTSPQGIVVTMADAISPQYGFSQALWGDNALLTEATSQTGASNALGELTQGGSSFSLGAPIAHGLRLGFGWSQATQDESSFYTSKADLREASSATFGASLSPTDDLTLGMTFTALDERNSLFGSTYGHNSLVNFGGQNASTSLGISAIYRIGAHSVLALDAAEVSSDDQDITEGLLARVEGVKAHSIGAALTWSDVATKQDRLTAFVRAPLQVTGGRALLAQTSVDAEGYAHTQLVSTALADGPMQTDIGMAYARRFGANTYFQGDVTQQQNLNREAGNSGLALRASIHTQF